MSDQEVKSDASEPDCEATVVMEDQQQQQSDSLLPKVDQNIDLADNEGTSVMTSSADSLSVTASNGSIQQAMLLAVSGQSMQAVGVPISQPTSGVSASTCQPLRIMSAVSSTGQMSGISLATKSPAFVLCQVTSGGQTILVPRSAVSGGIQLSSGIAASATTSVTHVPVFRSAVPLRTVASGMQGIVTVTSASSTAAAVVVSQTSAGVRLLRQAADGIRVIAGTNNAANRASLGVMLNRGTAPQRLAVAIAPANNSLRPAGTGSIRLVAIRNGTPLAIGGVSSSGNAVASPQLKLVTPTVPLSGVRPLTSVTAGVTAVPTSASTVSAVRQLTAVNDVQAYLRRIEELKSLQPEQGAKTPVTLATTVRTPLKTKTVLPTLTSAQQIVVLQSGSQQPQLANISATQLVSIFVITSY